MIRIFRTNSWLHKPKVIIFFTKVFFVTFASLFILKISLFGINEHIDRYSQDLLNTLTARYFYPTFNTDESSLARDTYSVLLINQDTLKKFPNEEWPLSADNYAEILSNLWLLEPKAVFIDIEWISMLTKGLPASYNHESKSCEPLKNKTDLSINNLEHVLSKFNNKNYHVFISVKNLDQWCNLPSKIRQYLIPVATQMNIEDDDFISRTYPLYSDHSSKQEPPLKSAALALCDYIYSNEHPNNKCINSDLEQIEILWGTRENPKNYWMKETSANTIDIIQNGLIEVKYKAPYATTVFAQELINPLPETNKEGTNTEEIYRLESKIRNKVIFIGAKINGIDDYILTPSRQLRPGVYYHAMAFDNLVSKRDQVITRKNSEAGEWVEYITILLLSIVSVGYSMINLESRKEAFLLKYKSKILSRFIGIFLVFLLNIAFIPISISIVLLAIFINSSILHLPAAYWIGYIGLVLLGLFIGRLNILPLIKKYSKYLLKGEL